MKPLLRRLLAWAQTTPGDYVLSFAIFIFALVAVHVILFWIV